MKKLISTLLLALLVIALPVGLVGCSKKENKTAEKVSAKTFFDTEWVCTEIISDKYSGTELYSRLSFNFIDENGIVEDYCYDFYSTKKDDRYNGRSGNATYGEYDDITWIYNERESKLDIIGYNYHRYSITYKNNKLYETHTNTEDDGSFEYSLVFEKR